MEFTTLIIRCKIFNVTSFWFVNCYFCLLELSWANDQMRMVCEHRILYRHHTDYIFLLLIHMYHDLRITFLRITDSITILFNVSISYKSYSMPRSWFSHFVFFVPSLWLWIPSKHLILVGAAAASSPSDIEDVIESDAVEVTPMREKITIGNCTLGQ